jgi:hypothetical protein
MKAHSVGKIIEVRLVPEQFICPICAYPSATARGRDMHHSRSHGHDSKSERNWGIAHMYFVEGQTVAEIQEVYGINQTGIRRILWRAMVFPSCYDLADNG